MSEELHIKAYELLEQRKAFETLTNDERSWVNEVFGSEMEYERMLSLSDMAMESDELIAPSLTTQTSLVKDFEAKHSKAQGSASTGLSLGSFLSRPFIRIAIPSLIVLIGVTWFLNNELKFDENVAEAKTEESNQIKNRSDEIIEEQIDIKELELTPTESFTHDLSPSNSNSTAPSKVLDLPIADLSESEIVLDDLRNLENDDLKANTDALAEEEETSVLSDLASNKNENVNTIGLTNKAIDEVVFSSSDAGLSDQKDLASGSVINYDHNAFTWQDSSVTSIGTYSVRDANGNEADKEVVPAETENIEMDIDESYGNVYMPDDGISNELSPAIELSKVAAVSKGKASKRSLVVSASSNAQNDQSLFEFLYTTY